MNKDADALSLSALRGQLFKLVDDIIATGKPIEIERNGHRLLLTLNDKPTGRLARLQGHEGNIQGDPEELLAPIDWEWNEERNLRA